jgi:hypothetical protein
MIEPILVPLDSLPTPTEGAAYGTIIAMVLLWIALWWGARKGIAGLGR